MAYVMFVLISTGNYGSHSTFQYEFKDKIQCENSLATMKKKFDIGDGRWLGYCQEVKK